MTVSRSKRQHNTERTLEEAHSTRLKDTRRTVNNYDKYGNIHVIKVSNSTQSYTSKFLSCRSETAVAACPQSVDESTGDIRYSFAMTLVRASFLGSE